MAMECTFEDCGSNLKQGFKELGYLLFVKHIFKTLFVISIGLNCALTASCIHEKVNSDSNDHKAYILEQKVDSLEIILGRK